MGEEAHRKPGEGLSEGLSEEQVREFDERGFTLLEGVFTREAAAAARAFLWKRMGEDGITRDPDTWVRRHGIAEIYTADTQPWDEVITPRLQAAVDRLCGAGRTTNFGCGWWVVTFPGISSPPWAAEGHWHVDGAGYRHFPDSPVTLMPPAWGAGCARAFMLLPFCPGNRIDAHFHFQ